jgi:hypothetical protein
VVVLDAFPRSHCLERVEHRFEFAHDDHVVEHREQACLAEVGLLVLDVPFILIDGDFGEFQGS